MLLTTLLQADPHGRLAGDPLKIMIMDTETTGFAFRDRILQFSACRGDGTTLVNELFKPEGIKSWPRAQQVNGISPEQVKNARTFREAGERCRAMMAGMLAVAGWNLGYDLRMMRQSGVEPPRGPAYIDLMRLLPAGMAGSKSLESVSCRYGFDPGSAPRHNAIVDVWATLHAFCGMLRDPDLDPPAFRAWRQLLQQGGNCGLCRG